MAYNVPAYDTDKFSIGPGILYLGPTGAEPTIDIGAVRSGMSVAITREKVDIEQGIPKTLVETFTTKETGSITLNGLEWNLDNLPYAMGAGTIVSTASNRVFKFGGTITFSKCALKFVHTQPNGKNIIIRMFKARGAGDFTLSFADDPHEIPYVFDLLMADTDWNGQALAVGEQLIEIEKQLV